LLRYQVSIFYTIHAHLQTKYRFRIVGLYTKSLALVADAFHYLSDLVGFVVTLVAIHMSERKNAPPELSFGWARATLLGAFFNGVFLLGLGLSILLQSIERFVDIKEVQSPGIVLVVGSVGLVLNLISGIFLHEHSMAHSHAHTNNEEPSLRDLPIPAQHSTRQSSSHKRMDLGMLAALVHVIGDAFNNIGVIVSALVIWRTHSPKRFYIDPAISLYIAFMILGTAIPVTKRSGAILLNSSPPGINLAHVKKDLEDIPGVLGVHELHIWQLNEEKAIASAHIVLEQKGLRGFMDKAKTVSKYLHAHEIHSVTLQPELMPGDDEAEGDAVTSESRENVSKCKLTCGVLCEPWMCCT